MLVRVIVLLAVLALAGCATTTGQPGTDKYVRSVLEQNRTDMSPPAKASGSSEFPAAPQEPEA